MKLHRALTGAAGATFLMLAMGCATDETVDTTDTATATGGSVTAPAGEPGAQFTMAEVEANDSTDSCWTVIDDGVYDVTEWVDQHPGGPDRIEQLCGSDGTQMFTNQHSGASTPEAQLAEFQIGELAD